MNLQVLVPVISKALGKDISGEVNLFFRARAAIGASLNPTGQEFFMKNWHSIPAFMETAAGRKATADFMNAWAASLFPKSLEAEPIPDPQPLPALAPQAPVAAPAPVTSTSDNAYL